MPEFIVVDDESTDIVGFAATSEFSVVSQPYSMGNGAAIRTGARWRLAQNSCLHGCRRPAPASGGHSQLLAQLVENVDALSGARRKELSSECSVELASKSTIIYEAGWLDKILDITQGLG